MNYIKLHWRGELELTSAFWINLVLIRLALLAFEHLLQPPHTYRVEAALPLVLVYFALSLFVIYPWQVVGVLRVTDKMLGRLGSMTVVHGVQFGIVASLLLSLVSIYSVFQPLSVFKSDEPPWRKQQRERAERYRITVDKAGTRVTIQGEFELGLTRNLRNTLETNPGVREIMLDSDGGYVNQGRAVANLIAGRGLDTRVDGMCKSACALAFTGGKTRRLGADGRLAFHQYRDDGRTKHPLLDMAEEHRKDRETLIRRGVSTDFAARVFQTGHADIWIPEPDQLLAAGVVHEILD